MPAWRPQACVDEAPGGGLHFFKEKYRLNYSETELVQKLSNIKNPIIKECIKFMNIKDRLYISTIADVPSHSGLGSSSSFTVGFIDMSLSVIPYV